MGNFTVLNEASAEFEEKKSIFIGHVKRVYNEEEAKNFVNAVRDKYKDARHNVFAYVIGKNMGIQRYSDDGEPQGTAGIPVLDVIKKSSVTDTVIVVTRYFGGILLGSNGLVRAYSKAASMAVKEGKIVERLQGYVIEVVIDYELLGKIQYTYSQEGWNIENIEYTDRVKLTLFCEKEVYEAIVGETLEVTSGKGKVKITEEVLFFKNNNKLYIE